MNVVSCRRRRCSRRNESEDTLNEGLLTEILIRLHCREAIKSKLVCKRWNSIISSDYFVTAFNHRRHDPSLPPIPHDPSYRLIFQFHHKYEYSSIVHCGSDSQPLLRRSLDLSFLRFRPKSRLAVVASCADLILCASMGVDPKNPQYTNYFVCNVQTEQCFALAPPPDPHNIAHSAFGFLCIPSPCSLCREHEGVDNSRYKFMVMRVHRGGRGGTKSILLKVDLFLSEEGEWTRHELSTPLKQLNNGSKMVPYRGMLHWLNYPHHVLVFDHYGQISRLIDIQFDGIRYSPPIRSFNVHQDRLRIVYIGAGMSRYDDYYSILELEDYDRGRWSRVKTFGDRGDPRIVYVHPDGNVAYCTYDREGGNTCIWFHNLISQVSHHKIKFVPRYYGGGNNFVYVKSVYRVTDQWWPTPVPSLGT